MSYDIVLDTNVLRHSIDCDDDSKATACLHVVFRILDDDEYSIALDTDGEILDEYKRNISKHRGVVAQRLENTIKKYAFGSHSGQFEWRFPIDEDEVSELADRGFHDDDLIFVRTSPKTRSESIISSDGESIADEEYMEWIEEELGVTVCSPEDANSEVFDG